MTVVNSEVEHTECRSEGVEFSANNRISNHEHYSYFYFETLKHVEISGDKPLC